MNIEVDYNPTPRSRFFISVSLNDKEAISFDYTTKGHRIIKQVLVRQDASPTESEKKSKPDAEWDSIVLEDKKFIKKYHVVWYDRDEEDLVNDELWETVWAKSIDEGLKDKLLHYSQLISDHYEELDKCSKEMKEFEELLSEEIKKHKKMIDDFVGVIIEESLEKKDVLKKVKILKTKVEQVTEKHNTPWIKQWTLHDVEIKETEADDIAKDLSEALDSEHSWYADFKNDKVHYIIFKNKIFKIDRADWEEYGKATKYGISLGIPKHQVDFSPHTKRWER
ncbi:hypothetical protein HQ545_01455 [Candidatus Woesearchaeota archaeon]|nr:hypothetical protein [Candidatus Woesearchaeota archaeon]